MSSLLKYIGEACAWASRSTFHARAAALGGFAAAVIAGMLARLCLASEASIVAFDCAPCTCTGALQAFHFARQPYLSDAQWIVFVFGVIPAAILALSALDRRLDRAESELEALGVAARGGAPTERWPWAIAAIAGAVPACLDVYSYVVFLQTDPSERPVTWLAGANWIQVLLVYGLELVTIMWITRGIIRLNGAMSRFGGGRVALVPRDPMGRLGFFPLSGIYDSMMLLTVALAAGAFAARVRSSGTIVQFAEAVNKESIASLLANSPWRLRWPNSEETPLLILDTIALVAVCWFPLQRLAKQRRAEIWWRLATLRQLEKEHDALPVDTRFKWGQQDDSDGAPVSARQVRAFHIRAEKLRTPATTGVGGVESQRRTSARALREEIQLLQGATVWPNGADRGGALLSLAVLFLIGGAAPILMVPLVALAVVLGIATRVSGFLQLALSGQGNVAAVPQEPEEEAAKSKPTSSKPAASE